ncbi:DUF3445 domain-containing protein [Tropicimonas sp. IMCC6043]|uniref:heme-dependent oxidative N-demethylase family protein n=1 Tax=Tropicimonas sp. IMCC6043 TaxID=2510645 RepID=UPI00101C8F4A|nr:DUF3445 domain-containing protein [Tropicimonas sp. IMCC6043]RYH09275.1 DUF3445 domain-containing protein [Tropicimonas sp. IMCC6043]
MPPILNRHLPHRPWRLPQARRLPGTAPIGIDDWLWQLDSYPAQMAERERLLAEDPAAVLALLPAADAPVRELYDLVLGLLQRRPGFARQGDVMRCPDGRSVHLDRSDPLRTLGRLVQEDLCLLVKPEGAAEHLLAGAVLCFPASWTLSEKLGRPMAAIHVPVDVYDATLAARVQRLLDNIRPGQPLARSNALFYDDPALFQPRPEDDPRPAGGPDARFFRSERQCLLRLPESGAVVFSIHTVLLDRAGLEAADLAVLH